MRHTAFILLGAVYGLTLISVVSVMTWQYWVLFGMWLTAGIVDDWILRTFP